jgi:phytoene synthase
MTPDEYCQDKAASSGSSFYYSFRFLPKDKRRAITALYAFCREVDDVVDECSDANVARTTLNWWRGEVAAIYGGTPTHPVCIALASIVKQFNLAQEHLLDIIDGMEMDLDQPRYSDFKSLQLYCYRVASVVGLLSAEILVTHRQTLKYARDLGIAFQLTNIIRDVARMRGTTVYLPMDEMRQFGVSAADILSARETENFEADDSRSNAHAAITSKPSITCLPLTARPSALDSSWQRSIRPR